MAFAYTQGTYDAVICKPEGSKFNQYGVVLEDNPNKIVALTGYVDAADASESIANAELFAAAPDMLAALIEATSIFDNYPETLELIGTYQVIVNAISKATGEQWN